MKKLVMALTIAASSALCITQSYAVDGPATLLALSDIPIEIPLSAPAAGLRCNLTIAQGTTVQVRPSTPLGTLDCVNPTASNVTITTANDPSKGYAVTTIEGPSGEPIPLSLLTDGGRAMTNWNPGESRTTSDAADIVLLRESTMRFTLTPQKSYTATAGTYSGVLRIAFWNK